MRGQAYEDQGPTNYPKRQSRSNTLAKEQSIKSGLSRDQNR